MSTSGTISSILAFKPDANRICSIAPENTVFEAIQKMAEANVGALLVLSGEQLVGVISERDYTRKVALRGKASKDTRVSEILTSKVVSVSPQHSVEDCMRLMTTHRIRHLPVLDGQKVVGVVSIGDLVNWIISTQHETIEQLKSYISGTY
jgi:CBS domain-containing protein